MLKILLLLISCWVISDSVTPWTAAGQPLLSIILSLSFLKLMFIESMMPSNHFILCQPLLLPSIFPGIKVFSNELVLHIRWPKCCSFRCSISPSNEYAVLISFRIHWFDLFAVQESSLAPQFKSIEFLVLSLLYGVTLISTWLLVKL